MKYLHLESARRSGGNVWLWGCASQGVLHSWLASWCSLSSDSPPRNCPSPRRQTSGSRRTWRVWGRKFGREEIQLCWSCRFPMLGRPWCLPPSNRKPRTSRHPLKTVRRFSFRFPNFSVRLPSFPGLCWCYGDLLPNQYPRACDRWWRGCEHSGPNWNGSMLWIRLVMSWIINIYVMD